VLNNRGLQSQDAKNEDGCDFEKQSPASSASIRIFLCLFPNLCLCFIVAYIVTACQIPINSTCLFGPGRFPPTFTPARPRNALTSSISSAARSSELGRLLDDRLDWRPSRPEPGSGDGDALREDPREPPTPKEKQMGNSLRSWKENAKWYRPQSAYAIIHNEADSDMGENLKRESTCRAGRSDPVTSLKRGQEKLGCFQT
jgi:hypothetical protein